MKKNGFTLLELMIVIVVVAILGVSAAISFTSIEGDTTKKELQNKYIDIQRAAALYVDLHSSELEWLIENGEVFVKIADLKAENYLSSDLNNPVTNSDINTNYYVKVYLTKDANTCSDYVNTCIVNKDYNEGYEGYCVADSNGFSVESIYSSNTYYSNNYRGCCPKVTECELNIPDPDPDAYYGGD